LRMPFPPARHIPWQQHSVTCSFLSLPPP
jgi:hypothetical protein